MIPVLAHVFNLLLVFAVSIVTMIYGWGVQPQSWLVIIGGALLVVLSSAVSALVAKLFE
jgi:hypothetical protein